MKHINLYLLEQNEKYGDPDVIIHNDKEYSFDSEYARAIIYNTSINKCIWSEPSETHNDMLFNLDNKTRKKFNLYKGRREIRYVDDLSNKNLEKFYKCGRIWVIPNNISKHRKFDVYIAWWNELSENEFNRINEQVIKQYNTDFNMKLESFIGVDNNGKFILIEPDGHKVKIDKQDKKRADDIKILKAIHLASQKEKNEFFKGWKEMTARLKEKELQRLGIRDGTYAKRNNMFAKHIVKDDTTGDYKTVYGAKIGDSLIDNYKKYNTMKSLIDYILEKKIIGFGEMSPKYGQCVILAGGAASGKGFIQQRIDMNGKVFDVDELKKKYVKMAKAGIFKDNYDYDLTKPEDVAKLHQKVKDTGLKSKERNAFWSQREKKKENHSSGLLPNIIFDMVSDDIKDVEDVVTMAKANGYNVTLVWVVCNRETAVMSNTIRGIDKKGVARSVPQSIIEKGHNGAYKTMTDLLNNKYPELNEFIDIAWIGFSSGWGRMLNDKYETSPVIKIKKDSNNKFIFNKTIVDDFLKQQQPINYDVTDKEHTSLADFRDGKHGSYGVKKYKYFISHADDFDESKMPANESVNISNNENPLIEALLKEFKLYNIL